MEINNTNHSAADTEPAVSVIVPLYNAEKYIAPCIDSILQQSLNNIEIIIIDDQSTDRSWQLCQQLYGNNKRVRLYQNYQNSGCAAGRNLGIKLARAAYLAFVDNDDKIPADFLRPLYETAVRYNADIVETGQANMNVEGTQAVLTAPPRSLQFIAEQVSDGGIKLFLSRQVNWNIWTKLYRRDFLLLNNIEFSRLLHADDLLFSFMVCCYMKRYFVIPSEPYYYRLVPTSLLHSAASDERLRRRFTDSLRLMEYLTDLINILPVLADNQPLKRRIWNFMEQAYMTAYIEPLYSSSSAEQREKAAETVLAEQFGADMPYVKFAVDTAMNNMAAVRQLLAENRKLKEQLAEIEKDREIAGQSG